MEIENSKVQVPIVAGNVKLVSRSRGDEECSVGDEVTSDAFNGVQQEEDEDDDGSNEDGDFDDEEIGDGSDDSDEEEEDGGFFLSNEDEKDDPLEHALDAMLDIEVQAHAAATALKTSSSSNNSSAIRTSRKRDRG